MFLIDNGVIFVRNKNAKGGDDGGRNYMLELCQRRIRYYFCDLVYVIFKPIIIIIVR